MLKRWMRMVSRARRFMRWMSVKARLSGVWKRVKSGLRARGRAAPMRRRMEQVERRRMSASTPLPARSVDWAGGVGVGGRGGEEACY